MSNIGIIAEFNPLHNGHKYLIEKAKQQGNVICVLSGNFVQRGETAIAEKRIRTRAALLSGADLVIELPVLWSMSTAQNFSLGAVSLLKNAGCDKIMFGSETGDTEKLIKTADILLSDEFDRNVKTELKNGITFASARQKAAEIIGADGEILNGANDNLGIEYIIAAKKLGFRVSFEAVKRKGASHDSEREDEFVSSSFLRSKMLSGDYSFCKKYMPEEVSKLFTEDVISDMTLIERAILSTLRTKSLNDLKRLPDISEGVENKLFSAIKVAESTEMLYNILKVKRYTAARLRRLVLAAFLCEDSSFFMKPVPYLRVLGLSLAGEDILRGFKGISQIPVIAKASDIKGLSEDAQKVFLSECRATDLYALSLKKPFCCGLEYTSKIIKTER